MFKKLNSLNNTAVKEQNLKILPDFLCIGAMRSGTTWLDGVLRSHPQVYLPTRRKEIHFFDQYFERGSDWYHSFFPPTVTQEYLRVGEITPAYLYFPEIPERISNLIPNCKFIAILRNPAERAYSHYGFYMRNYAETRNFEAFLEQEPEAFEKGLYGQQFQRYLKHFSLEQFLILLYDDIISRPSATLNKVADFLSIDASLFDHKSILQKSNPSGTVRFPKVRSLARNFRDTLRDLDLDWIWNLLKSSGIEGVLSVKATKLPPIPICMREKLITKYQPDIELLEKLTRLDCSRWYV